MTTILPWNILLELWPTECKNYMIRERGDARNEDEMSRNGVSFLLNCIHQPVTKVIPAGTESTEGMGLPV